TVMWWPESLVVVVVVVWVVVTVVSPLVPRFLSSPAGATPWAQEVPARASSPPSIQVVNGRLIERPPFSLAISYYTLNCSSVMAARSRCSPLLRSRHPAPRPPLDPSPLPCARGR